MNGRVHAETITISDNTRVQRTPGKRGSERKRPRGNGHAHVWCGHADAAAERFLRTLPGRPWCGNILAHGIAQKPRRLAVDYAHVQWNRETARKWLVFDLDRPDAVEAFDDAALPAPSFVIIKPSKGTAHYAYELEFPEHITERSRDAPQRLLSVVERAYTLQLGADQGYAGFLAKTPYHPDWITPRYRDKPFQLRELAAHIDVDLVIKRARGAPEMGVGRNCTIFEELRLIAYSEVRQFKREGADFPAYCNRLIAIAAGLTPIPSSPHPCITGKCKVSRAPSPNGPGGAFL